MVSVRTREFQPLPMDFLVIRFGAIAAMFWPLWVCMAVAGKSIQLVFMPEASIVGWAFVMAAFVHPALCLVAIARDLDSPLNAPLFQPRQMEFDEDGFIIRVREGNTFTVLWTSLVRVQETSGAWLLYTSAHQFHLIPQDAFSNPEDRAAFLQTLARLREQTLHAAIRSKEPSIRF